MVQVQGWPASEKIEAAHMPAQGAKGAAEADTWTLVEGCLGEFPPAAGVRDAA